MEPLTSLDNETGAHESMFKQLVLRGNRYWEARKRKAKELYLEGVLRAETSMTEEDIKELVKENAIKFGW